MKRKHLLSVFLFLILTLYIWYQVVTISRHSRPHRYATDSVILRESPIVTANLNRPTPTERVPYEAFELIRSHREFMSMVEKDGNHDVIIRKMKRRYTEHAHDNVTVPVWYADIDGPSQLDVVRRGRITMLPVGSSLSSGIFAYNALYAASLRTGMQIVLSVSSVITKVFDLNVTLANKKDLADSWTPFVEYQPAGYDQRVEHLDRRRDITLVGMFKDLRYWDDEAMSVLKQYRFLDSIEKQANDFIRKVYKSVDKDILDVVLIGVHIRHKNITEHYKNKRKKAYSAEYLLSARKYMERLFSFKTIVFIVCSDDVTWAKRNFSPGDHQVAFSEGHDLGLDFAIMTKTNHTIVTVGSFGRWAALLSGGIIVYYKAERHGEALEPWVDLYSRYYNGDVFWKSLAGSE